MKGLLALLILLKINSCFASNTIIAIVDDNLITLQSLETELIQKKSFDEKMTLLNKKINNLIQLNKAKDLGLSISNDDISRAIMEVATFNDISVEQLKQYPNFKSLKDQIIEKILILKLQDYFKKEMTINISIEELNNTCSVNPNIKKQIKIAQIIITELENHNQSSLSQELIIKNFLTKLSNHISRGASFEALAKLHSQHPSYIDGGLSDWLFIENSYLDDIDKLKNNEISEIFKAEYGWGIGIKVDERLIDLNLKKCEQDIINLKLNKKYSEWVMQLRNSSNIEIFSDKL